MKEHKPGLDSYIGQVQYLQEALERKLSEKELKLVMQNYIHLINIQQTLEELK